jgi:hypothetical protein
MAIVGHNSMRFRLLLSRKANLSDARLLRRPRDASETDKELPRSELAWDGNKYELRLFLIG